MISSEVEHRKVTLSIERHNSLDSKHEEPLDITKTRRKSVENLVISSQDAIGQSISNALSFSGAITQQASQIVSQDHRTISRSPSPCRRILESSIAECSDDGIYETAESNCQMSIVSGDTTQGMSSDGSQNKSADIQYRNSTSPPVALRGVEGRSKKKSWYSSLYPTYKSRSDDFKRLFKDLPDEERLIVDYSCALQKDILVHGRLYASQNYLCFYASIFGWETSMTTRWKDVTSITKEKTALVIPNAILVCTDTEKNFLTSFSGRDKSYLMLFRVWQNALMDQQISSQDIWQWVHSCYGDELGFGSDDEDYREYMDDEKLSTAPLSLESAPEEFVEAVLGAGAVIVDGSHSPPILISETLHSVSTAPGSLHTKVLTRPHWARSVSQPPPSQPALNATPPMHQADGNGDGEKFISNGADTLPTDMSDSSESEPDKPTNSSASRCMDAHAGRAILSMEVSVHIDQLFTMLFTNSKFCLELLATRNTSDYSQSSWSHNSETGLKCREVKYTMALTQAVGPKFTHVTENQVMNSCSKPGQVYSINITTTNAGVPYGDSFYVVVHYCLNRVTEHVTHLHIIAQIKYKKTVWGIVKGFIEKNTWSGLEEYCVLLNKALLCEADGEHGTHKRKTRRRRRCPSASSQEASGPAHTKALMGAAGEAMSKRGSLPRTGLAPPLAPPTHRAFAHNCWLWVAVLGVLVLLLINYLLYTKLHDLHERRDSPFYPLASFDETLKATALSPEMIAEWTQALQQQSSVHLDELERWRKTLNDYIMLIKQTESALSNLQDVIKSVLKKEMPNNNAPTNVEL